MSGRVVVVGSLNQDLTVVVDTIPTSGETVLGGEVVYACGGKGANQAIAAARAGAAVRMVGCVGNDPAGDALVEQLRHDGVGTAAVTFVPGPTGLAVIAVDRSGENTIIVSPGANAACTAGTVTDALSDLQPDDVVVAQAEISVDGIAAAADLAAAGGARFVLNLAPPVPLDLSQLRMTALVVNEHEACVVAGQLGVAGPNELAERLGTTVVVTRGADGVLIADADGETHLSAYPADVVVDTTGAGDAFVGALAAALVAGSSLADAVRWGAAAGSIAVAAAGAQGGRATAGAIQRVLGSQPREIV